MAPTTKHRTAAALAALALAGALTSAPAVPEATAQAGAVLWRADHEEGTLADWDRDGGGGEFNSGNGDTSAVAFNGRRVARQAITMNGASNNGTRMFRWNEADRYPEAYYSTWVYVPQRYSVGGWWNFFQFKSKSADGSKNDAFWQLNIRNRPDGQMYLYAYNWVNGRSYEQAVANLAVGQWVHVEAFLKQSDAGAGRFTVWQDGVQIFDFTGITTKYPGGRQDWSVNAYGDGINPSSVVTYIDDAAISTARIGPNGGNPTVTPTTAPASPTRTPAATAPPTATTTATSTPAPAQPTPTTAPASPTPTASYRVTDDAVRLREWPGVSAPVLAELRRGTVVEATDDEVVSADGQQWRRVKDDTRTGWIATQFLSEALTPNSNPWCQKRLNHPQCVRR